MRESPHDVELESGIEVYLTGSEGGDGRIKDEPEDFVVEEVPEKDGDGDALVFAVEKRGWETNHLVRDLARELGVSRNRIDFAGYKDKNAITRQRFSVTGVDEEELREVSLERMEISDVRRGARVRKGALLGNRFEITCRDGDTDAYGAVQGEVEEVGGFPNFFGIQRFGGQRPVTHKVGRELLKGDFEAAARIYLAESWLYERDDAREARERLDDEWGEFGEAVEYFPGRLRYERAILHGLKEGMEFDGAMGELSRDLMQMFVHAYQSYLFNRVVSERIRSDLPMDEPLEGDVVCFADPSTGNPDRYTTERVRPRNRGKLEEMVEAGEAFVTAPLPGPKLKPATGEPGELERRVIEEGVKVEDPGIDGVSVQGLRREVLEPVVPQLDGERFEFFLPKGCYATSLLREYTKSHPTEMV